MAHSTNATQTHAPEIQEGLHEDMEDLTEEDLQYMEALWRYIRQNAETWRGATGQEQKAGEG